MGPIRITQGISAEEDRTPCLCDHSQGRAFPFQKSPWWLRGPHWETLFVTIHDNSWTTTKPHFYYCFQKLKVALMESIKRALFFVVDRVFHSNLAIFRKYHHLLLILAFCMASICVVLWILLQTASYILLVLSLITERHEIFDVCSFYV